MSIPIRRTVSERCLFSSMSNKIESLAKLYPRASISRLCCESVTCYHCWYCASYHDNGTDFDPFILQWLNVDASLPIYVYRCSCCHSETYKNIRNPNLCDNCLDPVEIVGLHLYRK